MSAREWGAEESREERLLRSARRVAWKKEYNQILPSLQRVYKKASAAEKKRILSLDEAFHAWTAGDANALPEANAFTEWARTVLPGAFPEPRLPIEPQAARKVTRLKASLGEVYHGTRGPEEIMVSGICVEAAIEMVHPPDLVPDAEDIPSRLRGDFYAWLDGDSLVSPRLAEWIGGQGWSTEYDWPWLWRFYTWNWFKGLTPKSRKIFLAEAGLPLNMGRDRESEADLLGEKVSLLWVADRRTIAEGYAHGALLKFNTSHVNSWGHFDDDIISNTGAYVLVCPLDCPQVPAGAIEVVE